MILYFFHENFKLYGNVNVYRLKNKIFKKKKITVMKRIYVILMLAASTTFFAVGGCKKSSTETTTENRPHKRCDSAKR